MLSSLYIQNIAVIERAAIDLTRGLNVFTGETGAGKTVLLSALSALLGERASKDLIRTGQDKAVVAGVFREISPAVHAALKQLGFGLEDGELLLQREIGLSSNQCRINGCPATMAMLKTLGNELINIHGQQDNQMLMSSDNHRRFIDSFAGLEDDLTAYRAIYEELCKVQKELGDIHASESFKAQRMDMLSYQVAEIDAARLAPAEEEELLSRQRMLKNAERISGALYMSRSYLEGDGQNEGIIGLIDSLGEQLRTAERYIDSLSEGAQKVETMRFELEELQRQLRDLSEELEFDENELDRIGSRLDLIYRLKKKYGRSLEEVIAYGEKARAELDAMTDSDQRQAALLERSVQLESEARKRAEVITEKRTQGTDRFAARLRDELQQLAMPSVRLLVSITPQELGSSGADRVEFLMSPNPGEEPKPLSRIASGGEISRTMLAVKSVLADCADIDTLIFDEVDAGIGGRAAQRVGLKLKEVSRTRQVICVTHLAQVAAYADNHLLIEKQVVMDKTFTSVRTLDRTGRIGELARMSAGERLTELALKNAEEMLTLAAEKG